MAGAAAASEHEQASPESHVDKDAIAPALSLPTPHFLYIYS